jgi:hypothetical protein
MKTILKQKTCPRTEDLEEKPFRTPTSGNIATCLITILEGYGQIMDIVA